MAALDPFYTTGTVSVANGGTTVTGVGTGFNTAGIRAGDLFINSTFTSWAVVTADPTSATSLAITAWTGTALAAGSSYRIWRISDADRVIAASAAFMQSLVPNLTAFGGLTLAANKSIYATGAGALATYDLTPFARTLLDDANAPAALATIGAIGRDLPIPSNDYNLATTPGIYTGAGSAAVNGPPNNANYGPLWVGARSSGGNTNLYQIAGFATDTTNGLYVRGNTSGGTFGAWKSLLMQGSAAQVDSVYSKSIAIADDAAASFGNIAPNSCVAFVWPNNYPASRPNSFYQIRTSSSPVMNYLFGAQIGVNVVTTDVTGTTGTDGNVTLSATNGNFKIENRSGTTVTFNVLVLKSS